MMQKTELELKMEADTNAKINNVLDKINVADRDIARKTIQRLANAKCTCSCGGHYKGTRNDQLVLDYKKELADKYNIANDFLTNNELYSIGSFNGEGSF